MKAEKTRGIVLNSFRYGDTKIICTLFTESYGRQAFVLYGAGSRKQKGLTNLLQACFPIEIEIGIKPNRELQEIKEARFCFPVIQIGINPVKRAIAVFIAEVIYRFIREEDRNQALFDFLYRSVSWLEQSTLPVHNFHLYFLVQLSRFTGFYPSDNYSSSLPYFDLMKGEYQSIMPSHSHYLNPQNGKSFAALLRSDISNFYLLPFDNLMRRYLLQKLLEFYQLHLNISCEIKSLDVLNEVFT